MNIMGNLGNFSSDSKKYLIVLRNMKKTVERRYIVNQHEDLIVC